MALAPLYPVQFVCPPPPCAPTPLPFPVYPNAFPWTPAPLEPIMLSPHAPVPHSAVERARLAAYLDIAASLEDVFRNPPPALLQQRQQQEAETKMERVVMRSPVFTNEDSLEVLVQAASLEEEDDEALNALADAASQEAPLDETADETLSSSGDALDCNHCSKPFEESDGFFDAYYKNHDLGIGPLHFECVASAFDDYYLSQTGKEPQTQCVPVCFDA